jgi:hypothetical protein
MDSVPDAANNEADPIVARKPYRKPEITLELELESMAGSPFMSDHEYLLHGDIFEKKKAD